MREGDKDHKKTHSALEIREGDKRLSIMWARTGGAECRYVEMSMTSIIALSSYLPYSVVTIGLHDYLYFTRQWTLKARTTSQPLHISSVPKTVTGTQHWHAFVEHWLEWEKVQW